MERREALAPAARRTSRRTSCRRSPTSPTARRACAYNPGATALPERYTRPLLPLRLPRQPRPAAASARSRSSRRGPSFELADAHEFVWGVLATDCDFGPDGGFYVSDWVEGWELTGKGRIYRVADPEAAKNPDVARGRRSCWPRGSTGKPTDELAKLLGHADHARPPGGAVRAGRARARTRCRRWRRWRRRARTGSARLHAIWGLGQVGARRTAEASASRCVGLLKDARRRGAGAGGEGRWATAARRRPATLLPLLQDAAAARPLLRGRWRWRAERAGRRTAAVRARGRPCSRDNADRDAYLRHAGVAGAGRLRRPRGAGRRREGRVAGRPAGGGAGAAAAASPGGRRLPRRRRPARRRRGGAGDQRRADRRGAAAAGGAARQAEAARVPPVARAQRQLPPRQGGERRRRGRASPPAPTPRRSCASRR